MPRAAVAAARQHVEALGFVAILAHGKGLPGKDRPADNVDIALGLQPDGRYLYRLDLDSHKPGQDAPTEVERLRSELPQRLFAQLPIAKSSSGTGRDLLFYSYVTITPGNLYAPNGQHVGELLGEGGRAHADATFLHGGLDSIPTLNQAETRRLLACYRLDNATRSDWQHHKQNGAALTVGYDRVPVERVDAMIAEMEQHPRCLFGELRTRLHTPGIDRSRVVSQLAQCVMLFVRGQGINDRCALAKAVLLTVGAGGKQHDKDYDHNKDLDVLISKVIEGAPKQDGTHFKIPFWATNTPRPTVPKQTAPAPTAPKRKPGRPLGSADTRRAKLRQILTRRWEDDADGRIFYYTADLADDLGCSERTLQGYLAELIEAQQVTRHQEPGRGGRAWLELLPTFWGADNCLDVGAEAGDLWGANMHANEQACNSSTMRQTEADNVLENAVCIEEITKIGAALPACEPALAPSAPAPAAPAAPAATPAQPAPTHGHAPVGARAVSVISCSEQPALTSPPPVEADDPHNDAAFWPDGKAYTPLVVAREERYRKPSPDSWHWPAIDPPVPRPAACAVAPVEAAPEWTPPKPLSVVASAHYTHLRQQKQHEQQEARPAYA